MVAVEFSFPSLNAVPSPSASVFSFASMEGVSFTGAADGDFTSSVTEVSGEGVGEGFFSLSEKVSRGVCFSCTDFVSISGGILE